jgi:hypothetical protein
VSENRTKRRILVSTSGKEIGGKKTHDYNNIKYAPNMFSAEM